MARAQALHDAKDYESCIILLRDEVLRIDVERADEWHVVNSLRQYLQCDEAAWKLLRSASECKYTF